MQCPPVFSIFENLYTRKRVVQVSRLQKTIILLTVLCKEFGHGVQRASTCCFYSRVSYICSNCSTE